MALQPVYKFILNKKFWFTVMTMGGLNTIYFADFVNPGEWSFFFAFLQPFAAVLVRPGELFKRISGLELFSDGRPEINQGQLLFIIGQAVNFAILSAIFYDKI